MEDLLESATSCAWLQVVVGFDCLWMDCGVVVGPHMVREIFVDEQSKGKVIASRDMMAVVNLGQVLRQGEESGDGLR